MAVVVIAGLGDLYAESIGYSYDSSDRLSQVVYENGLVADYSYDSFGNRISKTVTQFDNVLRASASRHGQVSPEGMMAFNSGDPVVFTAVPDEGYVVGQWYLDGVLVQTGGSSLDLGAFSHSGEVSVSFQPEIVVGEWTVPRHLNSQAPNDTPNSTLSVAATDERGTVIAVWTLGATRTYIARSLDRGLTWSEQMPISQDGATIAEYEPKIETDGNGVWVIVWNGSDGAHGGDSDIFTMTSLDNGDTWGDPVAVNSYAASDSKSDEDAAIATDRQGNWIVVWQSEHKIDPSQSSWGSAYSSRSSDNGMSWSPPIFVHSKALTADLYDAEPEIATDRVGNWLVVWTGDWQSAAGDRNDEDVLCARSTNNGESWGEAVAVNPWADVDNFADDNKAQLATDRLGNWLVLWRAESDSPPGVGYDLDLLVSRSTNNGQSWSSPVSVNDNAFGDSVDEKNARIATDGSGQWIVFWDDEDVRGDSFDTLEDVFYSKSTDNGGTWSPHAWINPIAPSELEAEDDSWFMALGPDEWLAIWITRVEVLDGVENGGDRDVAYSYYRGPAAGTPPGVTSGALVELMLGDPVNYQITGTGAPDQFGAFGLPGGLVIDSDTGSISGVPVDPGIWGGIVVAANPFGADSAPLVLQIQLPPGEITWDDPDSIIYGTSLGPLQLDAVASIPGSFEYAPSAGTVLGLGAGQTLSTAFYPGDDGLSDPVIATVEIEVRAPDSFNEWRNANFAGVELEDLEVSGVMGRPPGSGIANISRYSLGLPRSINPGTRGVSFYLESAGGQTDAMLTHHRLTVADDVLYRFNRSHDLRNWSDITDLILPVGTPTPNADGLSEMATYLLESFPISSLPQRTYYHVRAVYAPRNFEEWRQVSFTPSELGDLSVSGADGYAPGSSATNLLLYANGLLRGEVEAGTQPMLRVSSDPGVTEALLSYRRLVLGTDLEYRVDYSDGLEGWNDVTDLITPVGVPMSDPGGVTETVTFRVSSVPGGMLGGSGFFRIRIILLGP